MVRSARMLALVLVCAACGGGGQTVQPALAPEAYDEPADPAAADAGADNPGELAMDDVEANLGPVREDVQACAAITTFEGKVHVQVIILPDGSASAEIVTGSGEDRIDDCVTDAFTEVTFPTSQRGQRFKYSFNF